MAWWYRRRKRVTCDVIPDAALEESVIAEARSVIEGRAGQRLAGEAFVPRWAWFNVLAHGTAEQLQTLTGPTETAVSGSWRRAVATIALLLVDAGPEQTAEIQTALFVPLELEALAHSDWPSRPDEVVAAVERRLHPDHGQRPNGRP